ncbi:MAG: hypothetical protein NC453_11420 [Muribaculum sp.]|nr:hypothetical protein [Muribaculum sp.]
MGLFDAFKKKKEEPKVTPNNPNSVFTLRFTIPYFQVFDKTNPKLRAFPVRLACGGSVQYRITDPTLCFDNVPLGEMLPEQLDEHVKDSLTSSVKHLINSIDYIPLLQFERELIRINDAAKEYLVQHFEEEYGISLRTFNLTRISYDEEDANYQMLFQQSQEIASRLTSYEVENLDYERERRKKILSQQDELDDMLHEIEVRARKISVEEEFMARELSLREQKLASDLKLRRAQSEVELEEEKAALDMERNRRTLDEDIHARRVKTNTDSYLAKQGTAGMAERDSELFKIELDRKRREMEEDMHARRVATDSGAKLSDSLGKHPMPGLGSRPAPSLGDSKPKDGGLDLGSL